MKKRTSNQWFRLVHKWAGLLAAVWLIVLGGTGFVLDHPDWRRPNQITVPESWGSPDLTRFIRVTYMRHILIDPKSVSDWLGGSERGLWSSSDSGESWQAVEFAGLDYSPQILALASHPVQGFDRALVGTDDGIWQISPDGHSERLALDGLRVNSLSSAATTGVMLGITDRSRVFQLDTSNNEISWANMQPISPVISGSVSLNRYVLNLHFGHGLLEGKIGVIVNDFSGLAMIVLGVSGLLYWFVRRRWKANPRSGIPKRKRQITAWLYRSHAPIIGILAVFPILYVSVTGIFGDHIRAIYQWSESVSVPSVMVPAGFSMRSLSGDVQDIVVNPANPDEFIIATRKGLYFSSDGGEQWVRDNTLPIQKADYGNSLNLFRVNDTLFVGAGLDASYYSQDGGRNWSTVAGPFTGISSGSYSNGVWFLKNSQGVFAGSPGAGFTEASVKPPPLTGMPLFLFLADIHTGHAIAPWFPWVNDIFALLAIILVCSGPVIWWRRKWI